MRSHAPASPPTARDVPVVACIWHLGSQTEMECPLQPAGIGAPAFFSFFSFSLLYVGFSLVAAYYNTYSYTITIDFLQKLALKSIGLFDQRTLRYLIFGYKF